MDSEKYWEDAALKRAVMIEEGAVVTTEQILKLYNEALEDIEKEIETIKSNFKRRFGIDNETAEYFLTESQQEENLKNLIIALQTAPDDKARADILEYIQRDGLSVRAYASRVERYKAVSTVIYSHIKKLASEETKALEKSLKNTYKESYYGLVDDMAKGLDVGISFSVLNDRAIDEAVGAKWHGKRFSERIWEDTDRLAAKSQELITKALMTGESNTKTSRKLADLFEAEKYHATTLVRTETAHIHAKADLKAYSDLGIEEYKYLATLDYKTCSRCQPLDGMVFKRSEAKEGVNFPTMHPRCRCTTTVNMDYKSRRARNPLTGKNEIVDGSLTYNDWINGLTTEEKNALDIARKKDSNRAADKVQYEKYKNVLGTKVVGRSFDKWQNTKYNDKKKWADLKGFYGYKSNNPSVERKHYDLYNALHSKGLIKGKVVPLEQYPVNILEDIGKKDPAHIMKRMKERNITDDDIRGYVKNAVFCEAQFKDTRRVFYSDEGVAVLTQTEKYDNIDWIVKTAWSKDDFTENNRKILEVAKKYV